MNCCYCVMREAFNLSVCREDDMQYRHNLSFTTHITDGNIDILCSLVYFRGEGNCSYLTSPMETLTDTFHRCIPEAKGTVPRSPMKTLTNINHRCFIEAKGIVPTSPMETPMICVRRCFFRGEGNCSHSMSVMSIKNLWVSCRLPRELPMDHRWIV